MFDDGNPLAIFHGVIFGQVLQVASLHAHEILYLYMFNTRYEGMLQSDVLELVVHSWQDDRGQWNRNFQLFKVSSEITYVLRILGWQWKLFLVHTLYSTYYNSYVHNQGLSTTQEKKPYTSCATRWICTSPPTPHHSHPVRMHPTWACIRRRSLRLRQRGAAKIRRRATLAWWWKVTRERRKRTIWRPVWSERRRAWIEETFSMRGRNCGSEKWKVCLQ